MTLAMLAWTAGPVTLLAAWSATWIGYGRPMAMDRVAYFVVYSVIAGVLGLVTRMVYNANQAYQQKQDRLHLLDIIDRLPELIYMIRDLRLANLGPDHRRIESAGILLRKFDLGPEWVAGAIRDLTGDAALAERAERIEQFRRAGLYNRMQDIVRSIADTAESYTAELRKTHPRIAAAMGDRLAGRAPDIRQGQAREPLFLERILAAMEQEKEDLITLPDVEQVLGLCFELICGREMTYLQVEYTGGDWNLSKALDRLERCRNDYRLARARVYSRLCALTAYIDYIFPQKNVSSGQGLAVRVLLDIASEGINQLVMEVNACGRNDAQGRPASDLPVRVAQLEKALDLYREVHRAGQLQGREGRRFIRALKVWQSRSKSWQESSDTALRRGLRISSQTIALDDEEKVAVSRRLGAWLEATRLRRRVCPSGQTEESDRKVLTVNRARDLAIETVLILTPHLRLHDPEVQRAIDSTAQSTLAPLEPGMSPKTKAALGEAMATAVEVNMGVMAEKLAQNLIRYYRVPLDEGTMDFLVDAYQADRSRLEFIAQHETPHSPVSVQETGALTIPDPLRHWEITLHNAHRALIQVR